MLSTNRGYTWVWLCYQINWKNPVGMYPAATPASPPPPPVSLHNGCSIAVPSKAFLKALCFYKFGREGARHEDLPSSLGMHAKQPTIPFYCRSAWIRLDEAAPAATASRAQLALAPSWRRQPPRCQPAGLSWRGWGHGSPRPVPVSSPSQKACGWQAPHWLLFPQKL